ncbi:MAG: DUF2309 domain-containing protein [Candidatus Obscuribacterales bacterium]|nr:DUF2309 domain-containing protein [Candidatus Obscuribacterales bacterium]
MTKQKIIDADSQRLKIRSQVTIASEILAPYWSIRNFVHHNPLHELEYLHFEEAVKRAQELLQCRAYLDNETYRRFYGQGLVSATHIDQVLTYLAPCASLVLGDRTVLNIDVFRANLMYGISAPAYENLCLLIDKNTQREAILALADRLASVITRQGVKAKATQVVIDDKTALARKLTLSQWCDRVIGSELTASINAEVTKWCAAFVDEGQAAWALPGRDKTLYGAWKTLSPLGPCGQECDSKNWRKTLESLPEVPEDSIKEVLADLEIPDSAHEEYFALHLSSLPGWASFLKWRAEHSGYVWQQAYPADLTQYLAIRLVYERELVRQVCRHKLDIEGTYNAITGYMESQSIRYFMLRQRVENKLPVHLAQKVDRLWYRSKSQSIKDWATLTEQFVNSANEKEHKEETCSAAWRLLALANCLKLTLQDLLNCSAETLLTLLNWLDEFPDTRHGLVWLKAMEASFQEKLLGQITESTNTTNKSENNGADTSASTHQRPQTQAIFCIDVRSEPFRRHLETVGHNETFGFAGFFICFIRFQSIGSNHETDQFPVIMKARNIVREVPRPYQNYKVDRYRSGSEFLRAARTLLHDLKEHVITPFVTVESLGWFYSLPLLMKTFAAVPYQNFSSFLRRLVASPVSTTLTIDKLSHAEASEMVVGNQLATIRRALHHRFALSGAAVSAELIEELRNYALNEDSSGRPFDAGKVQLPNLSTDEIDALLNDLRREYRISPRGVSAHMERITRTGFTLEEQVFTIETALRMMGLTTNFARIVLVCAHGSTSDNNPFESALDCGACGGNEGKANARAFAAMANRIQVREALAKKGIEIPTDTHFVPAQIDTTTDVVQLVDLEDAPATHRLDLARLTTELEEASRLTSADRCIQFPELPSKLSPQQAATQVLQRSSDWSQVRPEWGLSRNASFIIARREITREINLEGRAFLHSYDYLTDPDGKLLEILMTAPQVVTQWINMEHYFSTVDNAVYGCGSKVYHNVAGQIGVMSGTESDLRTGLPWQTVMSNDLPYHEPMRLTTIVEAPRPTIEQIIGRHELLKRFYHNEWVYLVALDRDEGRFYQYLPTGEWLPLTNRMPAESRLLHQEAVSSHL